MYVKILVDGQIKEVHFASNVGLIDSGLNHYSLGKHTAFGDVPASVELLPATKKEFQDYSVNPTIG